MPTVTAVVNPTIYVNNDVPLVSVEAVLEKVVLARYGNPPIGEDPTIKEDPAVADEKKKDKGVPVHEDWGVVVELERMLMREDIVAGFHDGSLTLRDRVGHVLRALPGRGVDDAYIERDVLTRLALEQWMVSVKDAAPACTQEAADWMQCIRDTATEWCEDRQRNGFPRPTRIAVCREMESRCAREGKTTGTGKPITVEYLRRNVLRRWRIP